MLENDHNSCPHFKVEDLFPPCPKPSKVYISGPITGLPNNNADAFNKLEAYLIEIGFEVINPIRLDNLFDTTNWAWEDYLARDIHYLLQCDFITFLPGWSKSRGAQLERAVAKFNKISPIYFDSSDVDC